MSITTDVLLDIASEKNGYKVGEPWRFSEFSLAAVIPITRVVEVPRAYRLMSEVKDQVHIKDTGSIDKLEIKNDCEFPILLKSGEVVAGATQERTVIMSQFVMSGEKVTVPCACVHSSKGIRVGQQVKPEGFVPSIVRRSIYDTGKWERGLSRNVDRSTAAPYPSRPSYTVNQAEIWGKVKNYSSSMADSGARFSGFMAASGEPGYTAGPMTWQTPSDDLAGRLRESGKKFEAAIKKVPTLDNQVGFCLVSLEGFDSLDVFNHPESWEAIRKEILKAEAGTIADVHKDNPFQYSPEKAKAIIVKLLNGKFKEDIAMDKEQFKTVLLESEELKGEVVTLYGQPVHLSLLRKG